MTILTPAMRSRFATIRSLLQDLRDLETTDTLEQSHLCGAFTASDGFAALDCIEELLLNDEEDIERLWDALTAAEDYWRLGNPGLIEQCELALIPSKGTNP